jgi:PAS domain S-box-containing protein
LDRKVVQRHAFAVLCVAVATTLRYPLGLLWPGIIVFATYYPAVLVATLVCGVPAGITATLLGAVSAWWLFIPPTHQFIPIEPASAVSIILYLLSSAVIVWAAGRYRMIVERLHSELIEREKGQKNNARLAALVTQSPDAIVGLTPGMVIETWNKGAERLFGYSAAEAVGHPPSILAPVEKQDEVQEVLARLRAGESITIETVRLTKAGERVPVSIAAAPVRAPDGRIIGYSSIIRDISERIRHQEQMQIVMHELSHRAKNLLAIVLAIANQMGQRSKTFEEIQARFTDRLQSFAASHDALVERNWSGVPMRELVRVQLAAFQEIDGVRQNERAGHCRQRQGGRTARTLPARAGDERRKVWSTIRSDRNRFH